MGSVPSFLKNLFVGGPGIINWYGVGGFFGCLKNKAQFCRAGYVTFFGAGPNFQIVCISPKPLFMFGVLYFFGDLLWFLGLPH